MTIGGVRHIADRVSRKSAVPLYQQLYEILRDKIRRQEWQPGDMISPESELCQLHGVSRTTVRQVLDMLVSDGLIYRERGRGTFVAHPTMEMGMVRIIRFAQDMHDRGLTPGTRVLSSAVVPAPQDIAAKLQVTPGEELARLERLRLANDEPMAVEESWLVHRLCPGVLQNDHAAEPLRQVLEQGYGIRLVRARQVIRAICASKRLAALLDVRPTQPLLFIERVSYTQYDVPVEFLHIYYRADRYSLYTELRG